MKLKEMLEIIPPRQHLRLDKELDVIIAMGFPGSEDIKKHENETVGYVTVRNNALTIRLILE